MMANSANKALEQADEETLLDLDQQAQDEDNESAHKAIAAELAKRGADDDADEKQAEGHPS
jgi:hypothetical protein